MFVTMYVYVCVPLQIPISYVLFHNFYSFLFTEMECLTRQTHLFKNVIEKLMETG